MKIAAVDIKNGMAEFLDVENILYIHANGSRVVKIYTKDRVYKPIMRLKEYQDLLEPIGFIRTQRSILANSGIKQNENDENDEI